MVVVGVVLIPALHIGGIGVGQRGVVVLDAQVGVDDNVHGMGLLPIDKLSDFGRCFPEVAIRLYHKAVDEHFRNRVGFGGIVATDKLFVIVGTCIVYGCQHQKHARQAEEVTFHCFLRKGKCVAKVINIS